MPLTATSCFQQHKRVTTLYCKFSLGNLGFSFHVIYKLLMLWLYCYTCKICELVFTCIQFRVNILSGNRYLVSNILLACLYNEIKSIYRNTCNSNPVQLIENKTKAQVRIKSTFLDSISVEIFQEIYVSCMYRQVIITNRIDYVG